MLIRKIIDKKLPILLLQCGMFLVGLSGSRLNIPSGIQIARGQSIYIFDAHTGLR